MSKPTSTPTPAPSIQPSSSTAATSQPISGATTPKLNFAAAAKKQQQQQQQSSSSSAAVVASSHPGGSTPASTVTSPRTGVIAPNGRDASEVTLPSRPAGMSVASRTIEFGNMMTADPRAGGLNSSPAPSHTIAPKPTNFGSIAVEPTATTKMAAVVTNGAPSTVAGAPAVSIAKSNGAPLPTTAAASATPASKPPNPATPAFDMDAMFRGSAPSSNAPAIASPPPSDMRRSASTYDPTAPNSQRPTAISPMPMISAPHPMSSSFGAPPFAPGGGAQSPHLGAGGSGGERGPNQQRGPNRGGPNERGSGSPYNNSRQLPGAGPNRGAGGGSGFQPRHQPQTSQLGQPQSPQMVNSQLPPQSPGGYYQQSPQYQQNLHGAWNQYMQSYAMYQPYPGMPMTGGGGPGGPQLQQISGLPPSLSSSSSIASGAAPPAGSSAATTSSTRAASTVPTPSSDATSSPGPHNAPAAWSASASQSGVTSPPPPGALKLGSVGGAPSPAPTPSPAPSSALLQQQQPSTPTPAGARTFEPALRKSVLNPSAGAFAFNVNNTTDFKKVDTSSKKIAIIRPPPKSDTPVVKPVPIKPSESTPAPSVVEAAAPQQPIPAPVSKSAEPTPAAKEEPKPAPAVSDEEAKRKAAEAAIFSGFTLKPTPAPAASIAAPTPATSAPAPQSTPPTPAPVAEAPKPKEPVVEEKTPAVVEGAKKPESEAATPVVEEKKPVVPTVGPAARDEPIVEPAPAPEPKVVKIAEPEKKEIEEAKPEATTEQPSTTAPSSRAPSPTPSTSPGPPAPAAIAVAKPISDLREVTYPAPLSSPRSELNPSGNKGKFRYDRDFLLQFMAVCYAKPEQLPSLVALGMADRNDEIYTPQGTGIGPAVPRNSLGGPGGSMMGPAGARRPSAGPPGALGRQPSLGPGIPRSGSGHFAAMGSFAPPMAGGAKTSAERFAASTAGTGRALPGSGITRVPSQSQAAALAMARNERPRSNRGSRRGDPRGGVGGAGPAGAHPLATIPANMAPLEQSANAWGAQINASKLDAESPQMVDRKVKALLNKLTVENFDSISNQILDWANKSEKETDGRILRQVIKLIFEKATDEAAWSEMYASLCRKLQERLSPDVRDLALAESSNTPTLAGGALFRKYLLTRCQEDYERGWASREHLAAVAADKAQDDEAKRKANEEAEAAAKASGKDDGAPREAALLSDEYYAAQKAKRRGLGLVRFIGELYKLEIMTTKIMHECVRKLLSNVDSPEEEDIESLCRLLTTVGKQLEAADKKPDGQATPQSRMDIYMQRFEQVKASPNITSRMRFMIEDVLESRRNGWRQRNAATGPKTIAQIHEDAARAAVEDARRAPSNAGRSRAPDPAPSRGGSRRGQARDAGPDGWSTITPAPPVRPSKVGDMSNFGKSRASTAATTTFGPTGAFAKRGAGTATAAPKDAPSPAAVSNPFAALAGDGAAPDAAAGTSPVAESSGRPRLVLAPRTLPLEDGAESALAVDEGADGVGIDAGEAEDEESAVDTEAIARSVKNSVAEWFEIKDVSEALAAFRSIPSSHRHELVTALATEVLSKKLPDVEKLADLFSDLAEGAEEDDAAIVTSDDFVKALKPVVADLDDLATDVPKAFDFAALLLQGAKLDEDAVVAVTGEMASIEEGEEDEVREKLRDKWRALSATA